MTAPITHPAILKAQSFYDGYHDDLKPHEQTLLTAVWRIRMACAITRNTAIRGYGYDSSASEATAFLAKQHEADELNKALAAYQEALEIA